MLFAYAHIHNLGEVPKPFTAHFFYCSGKPEYLYVR